MKQGGLIYGECGGLMYLGEKLIDLEGKSYEMVGILEVVERFLNTRT